MTPWVRNIIAANVAMFFLQQTVPGLTSALILVPGAVLERPWTLITYMFLHSERGLSHILFNMLGLFFLGPRVESKLGRNGFLGLYFVSGIAGALLSIFTTPAPILGASAAVFGVYLAFARYFPREKLYIWGILPIEARWFVVMMTVLTLWGGFGGSSGIAHFAHLGGFVGGFLFLFWWDRHSPAASFRRKAAQVAPSTGWQPTRWQPGNDASSADLARWRGIKRDGMHSLNQEELDRVLDKISAGGLKSLTPDERAFLERMSTRS
ncbi:MAG TPA: rhomboid family intramembrane serine protease [Gemmatimonadaceae bacterium]|nr:rhomboid family intramembrane serine protease [Gemmatimonadaceae bacterium]